MEMFAYRPVAIAEAVFAVGRTAGPVGFVRFRLAIRVVWVLMVPSVQLGGYFAPGSLLEYFDQMWILPGERPRMPSASAAPSGSLGSPLKYCRAAGRTAVASVVGGAAAVDAVDAAAADYERKMGMDKRPGDCVRTAEHWDIVERKSW